MVENRYELTTPAAQLVEVARIAAPYKNRPEMLMNVVIEVQKVVPALSEAVAAVIAREMGIAQTHVYGFITFYAMLSVKPHGKYIVRMCKSAPCHVRGAQEIVLALEDQLNIKMYPRSEHCLSSAAHWVLSVFALQQTGQAAAVLRRVLPVPSAAAAERPGLPAPE